MKTAELIPPLLDYWALKAEGRTHDNYLQEFWQRFETGDIACPSRDWRCGGPIIERFDYLLPYKSPGHLLHLGAYTAQTPGGIEYSGQTPLVAAMRAFVAARLGEDVPDL